MLAFHDVGHEFYAQQILYENVDFTLTAGQSACILGISGSGKSTLLNHAATLLPPKIGRVQILENHDVYALSSDEILKIRRKNIGIIFQNHYLMRGFTALENIKIAELLTGRALDPKILDTLKISHVMTQQIGTLSGGQQQRVSIARALAKHPKIIIADEPTGNLDAGTATDVMNAIFAYVREKSAVMLLATHDERFVSDCDIAYGLKNGALRRL